MRRIDLHGARGILVNVTAGPELSIGEFSDVGDIVENFASDQATVVVGTVIDPDLGDDLKVTVVATGLGGIPVAPNVVVDNTSNDELMRQQVDYAALDRPAVMRNPTAPRADTSAASAQSAIASSAASAAQQQAQPGVSVSMDEDMAYLDVPAFLRRQND